MSMVEQVAADLSHGARWLRRHLRFTGLSTLIIAIGVGGSTAIFSVADAVVLRPLPYAEADRLFVIQEHDRPRDTRGPASYPAFADWRNGSRSFDAFAAATAEHLEVTLTGQGVQMFFVRPSSFFVCFVFPLVHWVAVMPPSR
jgi:hypothetical protein